MIILTRIHGYGPNTPTTVTYNPSSTPHVLDIVITKDLVSQVYPTTCSALSSDHLHILFDTQCRSSFLSPPDRPFLRKADWLKFQACLEAGLTSNPDLRDEVAIDARVKELSCAITKALKDSAPKCRPRGDPRPPLLAHIQDEIRLKSRLRRRWQIRRDPALKAEVNRLQRSVTNQLNEWRKDQWSNTLESLDPDDKSLWKMTRRVMKIPTPSPPLVTPGELAFSDSEKFEDLANCLEARFQPVSDPSVPTVIEMVDVELSSKFLTPAS